MSIFGESPVVEIYSIHQLILVFICVPTYLIHLNNKAYEFLIETKFSSSKYVYQASLIYIIMYEVLILFQFVFTYGSNKLFYNYFQS